jgi:hypothetical protein
LPLDDQHNAGDAPHLSDDELRSMLLGGEMDGVDPTEDSDCDFYDPNFLARFRKPMTPAEEQEFDMAIWDAIATVLESLVSDQEPSA